MRFLLTLVLALGLVVSARAAPEPDISKDIRSIISAQIEAFKREDGAAAFSFASPDIQMKFRDPKAFLSMVVTAYPQVYRPQSVEFRELIRVNNVIIQKVLLRGPQGKLMLALYEMIRIDERWWINGCALTDPPGKEI